MNCGGSIDNAIKILIKTALAVSIVSFIVWLLSVGDGLALLVYTVLVWIPLTLVNIILLVNLKKGIASDIYARILYGILLLIIFAAAPVYAFETLRWALR